MYYEKIMAYVTDYAFTQIYLNPSYVSSRCYVPAFLCDTISTPAVTAVLSKILCGDIVQLFGNF